MALASLVYSDSTKIGWSFFYEKIKPRPIDIRPIVGSYYPGAGNISDV